MSNNENRISNIFGFLWRIKQIINSKPVSSTDYLNKNDISYVIGEVSGKLDSLNLAPKDQASINETIARLNKNSKSEGDPKAIQGDLKLLRTLISKSGETLVAEGIKAVIDHVLKAAG